MQVKAAIAFDKKETWRGLIAACRVEILPTWLQQIGTWAKSKLGLPVRRLYIGSRDDHEFHVVGVEMKWRDKSRWQLEERPERALGKIAPQERELHSRGIDGVKICPGQIRGGDNERGRISRCAVGSGRKAGRCQDDERWHHCVRSHFASSSLLVDVSA